MGNSKLLLAYIGTPDSYFTKSFLPKLGHLSSNVVFIGIIQDEIKLIPTHPDISLHCILWIRKIKWKIRNWSAILYWSVFCAQNKIRFVVAKNINSQEVEDVIKNCDFVLTAGIRHKFSPEIIRSSKNGIVNFHYSLLPKFRGTHPVFWQRIYGDPDYGYSFHLLNDKMDAGDIVLQYMIPAEKTLNLSELSIPQVCDLLTLHASNQLHTLIFSKKQAIPQIETHASCFTTKDYLNYISLDTRQTKELWIEKTSYSSLFILNKTWIVRLESLGTHLNKSASFPVFEISGFYFRIKKINYLPPVFYYFALRRYFGKTQLNS
jgi:hypothetical protein